MSGHWAGSDGRVSRFAPSGERVRLLPASVGAITNAHIIKVGEPWDTDFESMFDEADSVAGTLILWLRETIESALKVSNIRTKFVNLPDKKIEELAVVAASLIARSPRTRHLISTSVAYYRSILDLSNTSADKTLIAGNQRRLYPAYKQWLLTGGRWGVALAESDEFIFGDGLFNNFPTSDAGRGELKCIIPLTPDIALLYSSPRYYRYRSKIALMKMDQAECAELNRCVQIYSGEWIFSRSDNILLDKSFEAGEYLEYKYHRHQWLEGLFDVIVN